MSIILMQLSSLPVSNLLESYKKDNDLTILKWGIKLATLSLFYKLMMKTFPELLATARKFSLFDLVMAVRKISSTSIFLIFSLEVES